MHTRSSQRPVLKHYNQLYSRLGQRTKDRELEIQKQAVLVAYLTERAKEESFRLEMLKRWGRSA